MKDKNNTKGGLFTGYEIYDIIKKAKKKKERG